MCACGPDLLCHFPGKISVPVESKRQEGEMVEWEMGDITPGSLERAFVSGAVEPNGYIS